MRKKCNGENKNKITEKIFAKKALTNEYRYVILKTSQRKTK